VLDEAVLVAELEVDHDRMLAARSGGSPGA
jgi:hypothetical protein